MSDNTLFPYNPGTWEQIKYTETMISYKCLVTPQAPPNMDQGANTIDLSKGPFNLVQDIATYFTIEYLFDSGKISMLDSTMDTEGNGNMIVDLDNDLTADAELISNSSTRSMTLVAYGDVSGKKPITFKLTDEEIANASMSGLPFYSTLTFVFVAAPPAKATPLSKAKVTGIKDKTYTGKALTQTPVVKLTGKTLKKGTDYTIAYKNNKNVGKATVTITGKGSYKGTVTKTFKINPKGTSVVKLTKANKAVTVNWKKQAAKMKTSRINGYQIQLATNSKFSKNKKMVTVKGYSKVAKKVTNLKSGKKYYVRVRTFKTVNKVKYYSPWSKVTSLSR